MLVPDCALGVERCGKSSRTKKVCLLMRGACDGHFLVMEEAEIRCASSYESLGDSYS